MKKKIKLIISITIIMLISVMSLLSFTKYEKIIKDEEKDNLNLSFYKGNEKIDSMPQKDNSEGLVFSHATCDNGAYIDWDENEWSLLVKNLTKSKTKCTIFFNQPTYLQLAISKFNW